MKFPPTEGAITLSEEDAVLAALRPSPEFAGLGKEMCSSSYAVIPIKVRGQILAVLRS